MSETTKNVEEVVEEINPIDEYLNNYKEQKLAEFCVQKDKEIEDLKNERQRLVEQIATQIAAQRHKAEEYDKCFSSVNELYNKIKTMSVDEYLDLYNKFVNDITKSNVSISTTTISSTGTYDSRLKL